MTSSVVKSTQLPDGPVTVEVSGRITIGDTCDALEREFNALLKGGASRFVLDASQLKYIDSGGIGLLVMVACKAQAAGGSLCITGAKVWVHDAIARCRIETLLKFAPSVEDGIALSRAAAPHRP